MFRLPAAGVFRHRQFTLFWIARVAGVLALQMEAVALAWLVYDRARETRSVEEAAFFIGLIGLAQFLPLALVSPFAGQAADRYDRRTIVLIVLVVEGLCAAGFAVLALVSQALWPAFLLAAVFGAARAFNGPALQSVTAQLVPRAELPAAVAWNSLAWQSASIIGPAAGGYAYALSPAAPFAAGAALIGAAVLAVLAARPQPHADPARGQSLRLIVEGLVYLGRNRVVLGAISLDLMAVLLGGATALLPAYARDVLHAGPEALGHLRAAPAVGAAIVALVLAARPIQRRMGRWLFGGVAVFGVATMAFGAATSFWPAAIALAALGAGDMLSVYVRQTLIQLATPDSMRGRVSAVSSIFISASNELGEFESGVAARLVGVTPAVILGGALSLGVAAGWAALFPELRRADSWENTAPPELEPAPAAARTPSG